MTVSASNSDILILMPVVSTAGLELQDTTKAQLQAESAKKPLVVHSVGYLVKDEKLNLPNTSVFIKGQVNILPVDSPVAGFEVGQIGSHQIVAIVNEG